MTKANINKKVKQLVRNVIIVAPHADDEVIGCFSVLHRKKPNTKITLLYPDGRSVGESFPVCAKFGIESFSFDGSITALLEHIKTTENPIVYFPDPTYELHPLHKSLGNIGAILFQQGDRVIFYSTNMNAPYIYELNETDRDAKLELLNEAYFQKHSLWEYDHRYFLFEGYNEWRRF
jgi:hypothetical protein